MPTEETFTSAYTIGDQIDLPAWWNRIVVEAQKLDGRPIPSYYQAQESTLAQSEMAGQGSSQRLGVLVQWRTLLRDVIDPNFPNTANWLDGQIGMLEQNVEVDRQNHAQNVLRRYRVLPSGTQENASPSLKDKPKPDIKKTVIITSAILALGFGLWYFYEYGDE